MSRSKKYNPDYLKLYPELANRPDVLEVLRESDQKMKYMEFDLKESKFVLDPDRMHIRFTPGREISLEHMLEDERWQFPDQTNLEDLVLLREEIHRALLHLEKKERELIEALYHRGITERQYSEETGIPQRTINYRRHKILKKLREILKK